MIGASAWPRGTIGLAATSPMIYDAVRTYRFFFSPLASPGVTVLSEVSQTPNYCCDVLTPLKRTILHFLRATTESIPSRSPLVVAGKNESACRLLDVL